MRRQRQSLLISALALIAACLSSCVIGTQLITETADPTGIQGTYDLITYGCRQPNDIEQAAFLIVPEKAGQVELFVPSTSYKIKRGLPADQALTEANAHIRCTYRTVDSTRVHRIPDGKGGTLGFELLPRYPATDDIGMDPLSVSYSLRDGKVIVYIRLFPDVERKMYHQFPGGGQ